MRERGGRFSLLLAGVAVPNKRVTYCVPLCDEDQRQDGGMVRRLQNEWPMAFEIDQGCAVVGAVGSW